MPDILGLQNCKTFVPNKGWIYNHELNQPTPRKYSIEYQIELFERSGGHEKFKVDRSSEVLVWPTETMTDKREREQKIKLASY